MHCHICSSCEDEKKTNSFQKGSKTCKGCQTLQCDACQQHRKISVFSATDLYHKKSHGQSLVCPDCTAIGCTNRTPEKRACTSCHKLKGINKFDKKQWDNNGQRNHRLVCKDCEEQNVTRLKSLRQLVTQKDAWKCKCSQRAGHGDRCPLKPTPAGKRERWPGKNTGVLADDKDFLNDQKPDLWIRRLRCNH